MSLKTVSVMSRLGLRLRARRHAGDSASTLTAEDHENLETFEQVLARMLGVLGAEKEALMAGDNAAVAGLFEEKARLFKKLELHQPVIEPFLREGGAHVASLRDLIKDLADQLQVNSRLLKGVAEASRAILDEVERARSRQSLRGLYDKSGRLRPTVEADSAGLRKIL